MTASMSRSLERRTDEEQAPVRQIDVVLERYIHYRYRVASEALDLAYAREQDLACLSRFRQLDAGVTFRHRDRRAFSCAQGEYRYLIQRDSYVRDSLYKGRDHRILFVGLSEHVRRRQDYAITLDGSKPHL